MILLFCLETKYLILVISLPSSSQSLQIWLKSDQGEIEVYLCPEDESVAGGPGCSSIYGSHVSPLESASSSSPSISPSFVDDDSVCRSEGLTGDHSYPGEDSGNFTSGSNSLRHQMQTIYPNVQVHSHLSINGQSVTNANTNLNNHHHNDAAAAMMFASTQHRTPNDLNSSPTS